MEEAAKRGEKKACYVSTKRSLPLHLHELGTYMRPNLAGGLTFCLLFALIDTRCIYE